MTIKKIYDKDIEALKIASLPSRPTAPTAFGGAGYTAKDMKGAFDRLPLYIIERINELIDAIGEENGIIGDIPSGISDGHTLKDLTRDIPSGSFATYLTVLGEPLSESILYIKGELERLELAISLIEGEKSDASDAICNITSRIEDIEDTIAPLLELSQSLDESLKALGSELLVSVDTKIASAIDAEREELEGQMNALREEVMGEVDILSENVIDRLDAIDLRLEGTLDLEIDCGGPENL